MSSAVLVQVKGVGVWSGDRDVVPEGGLEGSDTGGHASAQMAFGEPRQPALDQIDPGGAGRRAVHLEAWPLQEPAADQGCFMGPRVVTDQMHVQLRGDIRVNRVEELSELLRPMPLMELPNDPAWWAFQGGEERRRARARGVLRSTLDLSRGHRQQRARPVQGWNLRLLIHTQHQGLVWRMPVESHNRGSPSS